MRGKHIFSFLTKVGHIQ